MLSVQILQNAVAGLKQITRADICVMDTEGNVLATTFTGKRNFSSAMVSFVESSADSKVFNGYQYFKLYDDDKLEYILITGSAGDNTMMMGKMICYHIQSLMTAYEDRFDRENFMKNLLLDNILPVDIYNRAGKLGIEVDDRRIVMMMEVPQGKESELLDLLHGAPFLDQNDFVFAISADSVILIFTLNGKDKYEAVEGKAGEVLQYVKQQIGKELTIAYGTITGSLRDLSRSYREAHVAADVSKIFSHESNIIAYSQLGLGRLIYQIPIPLCKMFINEIFGQEMPEEFDEEMLMTIDKFFENSLNISETSRQLYIHRNTLVYRLDKLQRQTGLDLRNFDDATTLKIALMVIQYMKYMDRNEHK